jgi:hypothetical protein
MMAIDDLLDRGRDAPRRRDEAANELAAVIKAATEGPVGDGVYSYGTSAGRRLAVCLPAVRSQAHAEIVAFDCDVSSCVATATLATVPTSGGAAQPAAGGSRSPRTTPHRCSFGPLRRMVPPPSNRST